MDLKLYYQKVRETTSKIAEAFPVLVSRETADGGKEGVFTEVPRGVAAKMIVEGTARLATPEEAADFLQHQADAKRAADQAAAASHVQFTVLSTGELNTLRELAQPSPAPPSGAKG